MIKMPHPFALPAKLSSDLIRLHHYWNGLKRGENKVPFVDDINLSVLPQLNNKLMLIDVFEQPQRFRFNTVGDEIRDAHGADITGKFVDEIAAKAPLDFFTAQASATVESAEPTYYHDRVARLLLPMWGDGHVAMLLGIIAPL